MDQPADHIEAFIARWQHADGRERANYQLFLTELAALLELPTPEPAGADERDNAYVFERRVDFHHGDGSESYGYIDLYRRGCFVLEAKDVRESNDRRYDDTMLRARSQAEAYARALPASEGRPPFVVVVDVGRSIELYSEFSRSGATYTPYPDPRNHRLALVDLRDANIRGRLRQLWLQPLALDPARESARVTREIAARLATLARSLEAAGHTPEAVAQFLMRCLFTMFAEDVKLLPADSFHHLLLRYADQPNVAMRMLGALWRDMDTGGFSSAIASDVLRFNGKLFKTPDTLPLDRGQVALLIEAARAKWEHVEPAIFGTLLERALDPEERHKLGAHYTPRAYVERLVLPSVIEPLRAEWSDAQAAALTLVAENKGTEAVAALRAFHHRLCNVRVLDPACGSGNFLYVTLEHLKRLEGEVFNALDDLGFHQAELAIDHERADAWAGETVDPHQLLGIELNPRAAAIAEVVLWIGYLQWHFRTHGNVNPPQPVVRDFRNIENRDAVLACDKVEYVTDERGVPVSRWDGKTMKPSPITGEPIPDEAARVPLERYVNPRKAAWPQADFVVGNPPFIGNKRMRLALGDGYVDALRGAWPDVPDTSDFVMYWWQHAAVLTQHGALQRFGFITTNSIRQTFNRRVIEAALQPAPPSSPRRRGSKALDVPGAPADAKSLDSRLRGNDGQKEQPLSLVFAIPDHPWVDSSDGADVRIAMTVAGPAVKSVAAEGRALAVIEETSSTDGEVAVSLDERRGLIHADLRTGANVGAASKLQANAGVCFQGFVLVGEGFILDAQEATQLKSIEPESKRLIRPWKNGRDLTQTPRGYSVLDLYGFELEVARQKFPHAYQRLLERVKPFRDEVARKNHRENWWIWGEARPGLRKATKGLQRVIVTNFAAKHRFFVFEKPSTALDHNMYVVCIDDASMLSVLSSAVHICWMLAAGSTLEDRPLWINSTCFLPFPFPAATEAQQARTRDLGEQLDAHRKRQQAAHPSLTLTGMYNVLEKLRAGATLTAKERVIHEQGLVSVLRQLHDDLDAAVLDAYGWSDLLSLLQVAHGNSNPSPPNPPLEGEGLHASSCEDAQRAFDEAILERLVALNAERAAEEARGVVRWLRPEFQHPETTAAPAQAEIDTGTPAAAVGVVAAAKPQPWPTDAIAQVRAVADALAASAAPLSVDDITARFKARGRWKKRVPALLDMLVALGRAQASDGRYRAIP